jgi:hypothetical protein
MIFSITLKGLERLARLFEPEKQVPPYTLREQ